MTLIGVYQGLQQSLVVTDLLASIVDTCKSGVAHGSAKRYTLTHKFAERDDSASYFAFAGQASGDQVKRMFAADLSDLVSNPQVLELDGVAALYIATAHDAQLYAGDPELGPLERLPVGALSFTGPNDSAGLFAGAVVPLAEDLDPADPATLVKLSARCHFAFAKISKRWNSTGGFRSCAVFPGGIRTLSYSTYARKHSSIRLI